MKRQPDLHIIVAMSDDRLIGASGDIPWNLPEDLKLFRELTMGNSVIMGRKTYESIGHPLTGRNNIVISTSMQKTEGIELFPTFAKGLIRAQSLGREIYCIGGREIYQEALPLASHLHISWIAGDFKGDRFFPDFDQELWQMINKSRHSGFTHISYQRKQ